MTDSKSISSSTSRWKFKPTLRSWITAATAAIFVLVGLLTNGFSGFLIMLAFVGLVTGIYSFVTGRASWLSIPSRKSAGITIGSSLVLAMVGSAVAAPPANEASAVKPATSATATPSATPTPAVGFSEDDPGDPATVTASQDGAAVVIADSTVTNTTAIALLATVAIKGKAPKTGYDRTANFGAAWLDVDRNGCDTRFPAWFDPVEDEPRQRS